MKTLPANIQTGRLGGNIVYLIIINGGTYRFATKDITIDGNLYDGSRIAQDGIGDIMQSVNIDRGGNAAALDVFNLILVNVDKFHIEWETAGLQSTSAAVKMVFDTGAALTDADCLTLGTFVVEEWWFDELTLNIRCVDYGETRHKDIPDTIISLTNFPLAPNSIIGKTIPITYGNFFTTLVMSQYAQDGVLFKDVLLTRYVGQWVHNDTDNNYSSGYPIFYHLASKQFYYIFGQNGFMTSSDGTAESYLLNNKSYIGWEGAFLPYDYDIFLIPNKEITLGSRINQATDIENLMNDDISDYAITAIPTVGNDTYLNVGYSDKNINDALDLRLYCNIDIVGTLDVNETLTLQIYADNSLVREIDITSDALPTIFDFDAADSSTILAAFTDSPESVELVLKRSISVGSTAIEVRCSGLYLYSIDYEIETDFTLKEARFLFARGKGYNFDVWIDAVGRSNSFNSGDLIEYAGYIIEGILRNQLGLTNTEIDTASFDAIGSSRSGWKFARQITDAENSLNVIADFCRECGLIYLHTYEGKEKILALKYESDPVKTITSQMIALNSDGSSSLRWGYTGIRDVFNDFTLFYQENYADGSYWQNLFVNKNDKSDAVSSDLQDLCSDSYSGFGFIRKLEFKSKYIRDEDTALLLLDHLVRWLARRKRIASFRSSVYLCDLEIGDQIIISNTGGQSGNPELDDWGPTDCPNMMVTRVDVYPSTDTMYIELIEIPADLP